MNLYSTYSVKIKHYNNIFRPTIQIYRDAVDFFLEVILDKWDNVSSIDGNTKKCNYIERLTIRTKQNPDPEFPFEDADRTFYKMPAYLRRAAISEAFGKASSYMSSLANWEASDPAYRGKKPGYPKAGYIYPALYRDNMFIQTGSYEAKIKVFVRNTWDWITVSLRKSDMDYITRRCRNRKQCAPTIQRRGKEWFLDFPFEEQIKLGKADISDRIIVSVDLGINNAATASVMQSDGTILGRHFLKLPKEQDSLMHAVNRIKKAQQHGALKMPRLWARVKGINDDIAVKTAHFIIDTAVLYNADVIVFEHLDLNVKKRGAKKQRLHLWKAKYVQSMVTGKAHRLGIRVSHICARNTSRLAYDGSGPVLRGSRSEKTNGNYSVCEFANGKIYNCDLNAAYNIGARYFIREILKSLPETARLQLEAKVPQACKRSTCTLSVLYNLNAALAT